MSSEPSRLWPDTQLEESSSLTDGTPLADNAYVSGMKDDLGFVGNELVQLQTMYTVGAVVGQIPFMFLFTVFPMNWIIPFLDVCWGIFTLLQFRANSFAEIAAYRFLVGWFEVGVAVPIPCHFIRTTTHMLTFLKGRILSCHALYIWRMVQR